MKTPKENRAWGAEPSEKIEARRQAALELDTLRTENAQLRTLAKRLLEALEATKETGPFVYSKSCKLMREAITAAKEAGLRE